MPIFNVRNDFPLLRDRPELCYLDSAATSQKPEVVIERVVDFLSYNNANVGRGVYHLSDTAEIAFETARETVAKFIGAKSNEIVFTQNATAAINIVARGFRHGSFNRIRHIYLTNAEHNSNYLPWFSVGLRNMFDHQLQGGLTLDNQNTHLVTMTHLSNVLGQITPVRRVVEIAHASNVPVLVDAAQSIGHLFVNVEELGCDFLVFSAHKMLGLTGLGVLYINEKYHDDFTPVFLGGGAVHDVTERGFTWRGIPEGLEAGTPPIIEAISLTEAINYLNNLGLRKIEKHIASLTCYCYDRLIGENIVPLGGSYKHGLVSFNLDNLHPHDVAFELDKLDIAVRAGHHCAPICHQQLGINGSVRASFHVYNNITDVDRLIEGLRQVRQTFRK